MEINHYLDMTYKELIRDFFTIIINDSSKGLEIIKKIEESKRYRNDYEFRTTILTAKGLNYCLEGMVHEAISLINTTIINANSLKLYELVSRNWNSLGVTYLNIGMYEKAVECFHNVVKVEKKNGFLRVMASAYSNIGSIFLVNSLFDKACKYYELALETLKKGGEDQVRYHSELQVYYCNLVIAYSENKRLDLVPKYLKLMEEIGIEEASERMKYLYYSVKMVYHFYNEEVDEAKHSYFNARKNINPNNHYQIFNLMINYIEKSAEIHQKDDLYEKTLLELEELQEKNRNLSNIFLYKMLREYYMEKENYQKVKYVTMRYLEFLEKEIENTSERQSESISLVDEMLSKVDEIDSMKTKNLELEFVAEEAIKNKNSLQKAYHQIDLINQLGKRLTSSIKFNEVVDLIYKNVSENIPTKLFVLMVKNENDDNILDTLVFYSNGEKKYKTSLDLRKMKGLVAECYYNNKIISSSDKEYRSFFEKQKLEQDPSINSAIYLPLNVDEEIIGICTVQDSGVDVYTDEEIEFLKGLLPYLSISLNNAIRSRSLEKEIQSHLSTQKELKDTNRRLEALSTLDGLTQINGRRIFGIKLIEAIEEAVKTVKPLSIIMIDIDNFKAYNDNYGHLEGDEILKKVAKLFERIVREASGLAARFGGEEFIAVCLDLDFKKAMKLGEKIRSAIYNLNLDHEFSSFKRITTSVGISVTNKITMTAKNEFIKEADHCLYEAKNTGKNKVIGREVDEV